MRAPMRCSLGHLVGRALLLVRAIAARATAKRPRTRRKRWRSMRATRGRAWPSGCASRRHGQHDRALGELRAALNLNPSFALGHMAYRLGAAARRPVRRGDRRDRAGDALSARSTVSPASTRRPMASRCSARERFDEALPFLRTSVAAFAEYSGHYNTLISCCGHLGLMAEAQEFIARRNRIGPPLRLSRAAREPAAVRASRRVHRGAAQGRRAGVVGR